MHDGIGHMVHTPLGRHLPRQTPQSKHTSPGKHPHRRTPPPPRYIGYYGILSTSGQYASYWNALLLSQKFTTKAQILWQHRAITLVYPFKPLQFPSYWRQIPRVKTYFNSPISLFPGNSEIVKIDTNCAVWILCYL